MNTDTAAPADDDAFGRLVARAVRELPDAPEALQRAAIDLFPAAGVLSGVKALAQAVVAQIGAVLTFDSWATPALAAGLRAGRASTRHLLYSAQGRDIDLRVTPEAGAFVLAGQILGPDDSGRVELADAGDAALPAREVPLDALGEFRLPGVVNGAYRLTLHLADARIELPTLEVGESAGAGGA